MTRKLTTAAPPSNDAAQAFDDLRSEISLQRTAIEGLTAAKEKLPDYLPTLRDMGARLDQIDQHIASINDKPAMRLTPLTLAAESHQASMAYGAEDRKSVGEARDALSHALGRVEGMIKQQRSNDEQDWWVTWAATGGVLLGAFLALVGVATWS